VLRGDLDEAIGDFNRTIQLQPTYPLAREHRDLAREMRQAGRERPRNASEKKDSPCQTMEPRASR